MYLCETSADLLCRVIEIWLAHALRIDLDVFGV